MMGAVVGTVDTMCRYDGCGGGCDGCVVGTVVGTVGTMCRYDGCNGGRDGCVG